VCVEQVLVLKMQEKKRKKKKTTNSIWLISIFKLKRTNITYFIKLFKELQKVIEKERESILKLCFKRKLE
jgi:hypothetical protein